MFTILENCRVSPPPATVGERSLPLTFFDTLWLLFFPVHQLFFYEFPCSKDHFIQTIVPDLKHSLSITLRHFFPFAGNLIVVSTPGHSGVTRKPEIRHVEGDSVALTFAECNFDFKDLVGNYPRSCDKFYPLVPPLGRALKASEFLTIPLFSVQVTLFPNSGISIGITNHHVLCDASTKFEFLKAWTSIFRSGTDELFLTNGCLPFYDRVIEYPNSLDEIYLKQSRVDVLHEGYQQPQLVGPTDKVRATFILTRAKLNLFKKWVLTQLPSLEYVSSFSIACAYVWSCVVKSRVEVGEKMGEDNIELFICAADCRARLDPPIPQAYFGNCVAPCFATTKTTRLSENKGFVTAVELLGKAIRELGKNEGGLIKDAETWIERCFATVPPIGVAGTPKLKIYDVDFGWGKPRKYETISIDHNGSISINACKESPEDIEIGLSLPAKQMEYFVTLFGDGLESIFVEQQ